MSGREGVQMLVDIVAKGGNLLLNIAPSPEGEWQQGAYDLLKEYGAWLDVNGEAIYKSEPIEPFKENNICMTQQENGKVYFFYLPEDDNEKLPAEITIQSHQPARGAKVTMLGSKNQIEMAKSRRWI